jgi:hypothetical protein
MVFQRCSDLVESSGGARCSMPKAAGMQLLVQFRNSPDAPALGGARTSDDHSPQRTGLLIDQFGTLSIDDVIGVGK